MYRNLMDGVWFGLSMLAGAYVGSVVFQEQLNVPPNESAARLLIGATIGAVIGGGLWKWFTWGRDNPDSR